MSVVMARLLRPFSGLGRAYSSCLLFPGQGSQYVGMGKQLIAAAEAGELPGVLKLFQTAEEVLGYDLRPLFLRGPPEKLEETVHCQPAVVVASLAALEALKQDQDPQVLVQCQAAAGFSVGELTALIAAKSMSLEHGLEVVRVRSLAMQEACLQTPGAMATVIGLESRSLQSIIASVWEDTPPSLDDTSPSRSELEICIGNFLFPRGMVISGEEGLVKEVGRRAEDQGASVKPVPVSGAFHSRLMAPAVPKLQEILNSVRIQMPNFPVYSNVTGLLYGSVDEIRTGLSLQVTHPVLWGDSMLHMIGQHVEVVERGEVKRKVTGVKLLEVGPGRQLKGMLKRISRTGYRHFESISV